VADEIIEDNRLVDPLRSQARLARRNLLILSVIGLAVSKVGLVPTKVAALGIEFNTSNQQSFTYLVAGLTVYFMLAFSVHGLTDYVRWKQHNKQNRLYFQSYAVRSGIGFWFYQFANVVAIIRTAFEFLVPVVIGGLACYWLAIAAQI